MSYGGGTGPCAPSPLCAIWMLNKAFTSKLAILNRLKQLDFEGKKDLDVLHTQKEAETLYHYSILPWLYSIIPAKSASGGIVANACKALSSLPLIMLTSGAVFPICLA